MKYKYRTKPYKHQVLALKTLLKNEWGGALLMDPRTGKSKVFIDWVSILFLQGKVDRCIIPCPPQMIEFGVWQEQWEQHCPYEYDLFVWDRKARANGGLPAPKPDRLLVVLVNYEAFSTPGRKLPSGRRSSRTGRIKARNEIRRWAAEGIAVIGLDEAHIIKTASSKVHNFVVSLYNSFPYRAILTGTVVTKSSRPHDVRNQWQFLNPHRFAAWPEQEDFKNYFGVWTTHPNVGAGKVPIFRRGKNMDELHELMMRDSFTITREECFDLPPKDIQRIHVELGREAKVYDQMATQMVAEIRQYVAEAKIPLVKILRLSQISGGFVTTENGSVIRVGTSKIDAIRPHVAQCLENGERFAITARFKPELDALYNMAKSFKVPVFEIRGRMPKGQMRVDKQQAIKHKGPLIYILQPRAASLGIDLSFLSRMMWYSLTNSFVDYTQCCDRIALSRKNTTFTYFLCPGIDTFLYDDVLTGDGQFLQALRQRPERILRNSDKL